MVTVLGSAAGQTARILSIDDAVCLAKSSHPLAAAARARTSAAVAHVSEVRAPAATALTIAHGAGQNTGGLDEDITVTQSLEVGSRANMRVRAAAAEARATAASQEDAEQAVALDVRIAYFEALHADAMLRQADEGLRSARAFCAAAAAQFAAGDAPRSSVLRSEMEGARCEQIRSAAQSDVRARYGVLRSLLGLPPDAPMSLQTPLSYIPVALRVSDLRECALRRRADLRAGQELRASREADRRSARDWLQPTVFLEARHSTLDPGRGGNSVRFGLELPLVDWGRLGAERRVADAAVQEQEALARDARRVVVLAVESAYEAVQQAQQSVQSFTGGRLARAKQLLEMVQVGYSKGALSYLDLLDARGAYRMEMADYLRAVTDANEAVCALIRAVGGKLP